MKKIFLFVIASCSLLIASAQQGCSLRISLLTCAPGEELYSTFGHTAIRVQDGHGDYVFNYGTFEFSPDFYTKFIKGKLLYYLSVQDYNSFVMQYQAESRSIVEQELNYSCLEKQKLSTALQINTQEENKYYRYDFLYDNCTTRARDMISQNALTPVTFKNILPPQTPTFRNLIHEYLNKGGQYWSKLGIDLALGAKLDRKVSNEQAMFLPDYLLKGLDKAEVSGKPVVARKSTILEMPSPARSNAIFTPVVMFSALLLIVLFLSFRDSAGAVSFLKVFDVIFFLGLGLIGALLLFMWFGTDHNLTQNNYNLLWALPTHLIAAFLVNRSSPSIKIYFKAVLIISIFLLLLWFFLPQQMNAGFLPILLLIILRSSQISKPSYGTKRN